MLSPEEIRSITFDKAMRGYNSEDVDAFIEQIADQVTELLKEKENLEEKLYILADKIEEYRKDEDAIKQTLVTAQKESNALMATAQRESAALLQESRQKAENMIVDAKHRAEHIHENAQDEIKEEQLALAKIKAEVADFRATILNIYKQHIEMLSNLPTEGKTEEQEEQAEPEMELQEPVTQEIPVIQTGTSKSLFTVEETSQPMQEDDEVVIVPVTPVPEPTVPFVRPSTEPKTFVFEPQKPTPEAQKRGTSLFENYEDIGFNDNNEF
ncbi:MAG: DivIVA domain-containing protein [Oscillospiraceae bacterium]|nr:DivIVA domain-containing protein [Oscillospiraceae bacterium]